MCSGTYSCGSATSPSGNSGKSGTTRSAMPGESTPGRACSAALARARPRERGADRVGVGYYRVAGEGQRVEAPAPRRLVAAAAGVGHHDRHVAEVGRVADRRLDPDLERDAGDEVRAHAAVAQHDV